MKHSKQTRLDSLLTHVLLAFVLLLQSALSDRLLPQIEGKIDVTNQLSLEPSDLR